MDRTIITDRNGVHTEVHYHLSGPAGWVTQWHQTHAAPPYVGWVVAAMLLVLAMLYFLPTLVARARGVHGVVAVAVLNLLIGWTVLGWIIALTMALVMERRIDHEMRLAAYRHWADGQAAAGRQP